ncbi:MAG: hypothetical protein BGO98_23505 [Myxococcales bacterium 68-20]|mgnify:CR=1 FL=1|nr:hypothetical protein [Myxococcales bacterium]OJY15646.1 MAG: hypothetical protein BGO98_23505 [Myxococcales bacterium 68-20]
MAKLTETIDRLVTALADDIIAAVRDIPLDELAALTGKGIKVDAMRPATKAVRRKNATKERAPAPPKAPPVVRDHSAAMSVAQRFFEERGQRGATAPQLHEVLEAGGLAQTSDAADVISLLVARGVVGDAGFRRTTGSGTAAVYVRTPAQ